MSETMHVNKKWASNFIKSRLASIKKIEKLGKDTTKRTHEPLTGGLAVIMAAEFTLVWLMFDIISGLVFELKETVSKSLQHVSTLAGKSGDKKIKEQLEVLEEKMNTYEPILKELARALDEVKEANQRAEEAVKTYIA